jgi:hypothetical protein
VGIGVLPQEINIPMICRWLIPMTAPYVNAAWGFDALSEDSLVFCAKPTFDMCWIRILQYCASSFTIIGILSTCFWGTSIWKCRHVCYIVSTLNKFRPALFAGIIELISFSACPNTILIVMHQQLLSCYNKSMWKISCIFVFERSTSCSF